MGFSACWYAKHPPSNLYCPRTMTITLEVSMESISQYSGFMMMMMLNHHKPMQNERLALTASEFE